MANKPIGIMLMNLGGPDTPGAIKPFLYNLFSDRQIIPLGPPFMQKPLAWLISTIRAPKTTGYYKQIGGASPIVRITNAQAEALERRMREHGDFRVYVGMRYWKPFTADTLERAHADGVRRLISLSLYPQFSRATTGSSEDDLGRALARFPMEHTAVAPWYNTPAYIDALVDVIRPKLSEGTVVVFTAHSLPQSFIDEGDPYVEHTKATIAAIAERVDMDWRLGYQSRSGPVKWLEPSTEDVLKKVAQEGYKKVLMVPISFVSDHIETLYEIDILYKQMSEGLGLSMSRTESMNTHPMFILALESLALKEARAKGWV